MLDERKVDVTVKKYFFPFIYDFIVSLFLFIGVPITLLTTHSISIDLQEGIGVLTLLVFVFLYVYFLASYFIPGIYAVMDLFRQNFVTEKMSYVECYIASNKFYGFRQERKRPDMPSKRLELQESFHLRVILSANTGKSAFRMTQFHKMEKGKSYNIQYGGFSKIIISISDADGEHMLLGD